MRDNKFKLIKIKLLILVFLVFSGLVTGQNKILSKVLSVGNIPLPGASVMILNPTDSLVLNGTITNEKGEFSFKNVRGEFLLHVSYIGYQTQLINSDLWLSLQDPIVLKKSENQLQEITVTKARNAIKVAENKIVFKAEGIAESRASTNAFELFDYVPGLMIKNDQVTVVGANKLTVVINNKITNMGMDQVMSLLKSTPANQVKNIEYYYVAPKKFNVHGALINVELKQGIERGKYSCSISGNFRRGREISYDGNLNYSMTKGRLDFQAIVNNVNSKINDKQTIITSLRNADQNRLNQFMSMSKDKDKQLYSLNPRLNINDNSHIDIVYSFIPETKKNSIVSDVDLILHTKAQSLSSNNFSKSKSDYHNIALTYLLKNLNVGLTYVDFQDPTNQTITKFDKISNEKFLLKTESRQDIREWNAYVNNNSVIKEEIATIDYGLSYMEISNRSGNNEFEDSKSSLSKFKLKENRVKGFVSFNYKLSSKMSSIISLEVEYDKLQFNDMIANTEFNVVDDYFVFPTIDFTYMASNRHIFKANFSSFSEYPSFWDLTPNTWTLTPFANVVGNPNLKPQRTYNTQLVYIYNGKYILVLSGDMYKEWITQVPFNGEDNYSISYKSINVDKNYTGSISLIIPFSPAKSISSKLTVSLSRNLQKDSSYENYAVDKKNTNYYFALNNSFTINRKREIFADLNAYYASPRPQGFYDLKESFCVDASVRIKVLKNGSLLFSCKDIFRSKTPKATTNFKSQYNDFDFDFDTRQFKVGFVYNFGDKIKMRKKGSDLEPSERFYRN